MHGDKKATSKLPSTAQLWAAIKRYRRRLIASFVLVMHCLGFLTSVQAIMATRTSQGAIAWAVSLNTFPYIAVPAYWVFGQSKFSDYEVLRRIDLLENTGIGREVKQILEEEGMSAELETDELKQRARLLEQQITRPPLPARRRHPRLVVFRSSIAWLQDSLSTLRSADYPAPRKTHF